MATAPSTVSPYISSGNSPLIKEYQQNGYVIVRRVLDIDLMVEARSHIDWLLAKNPGLRPEELHHHLITKDAFWVRLVSDERLLNLAEMFLGPDIGLFASHYIAKPPREGKSVAWHQDGSYWPLEPMKVISFWLSLDRSDEQNGCMKVIPGTQNETLIDEKDYVLQSEESVFERAMEPSLIDESKAVSLILEPGDVSIHHPNIFHGSHGNRSSRWRRGLTIRYIPVSTKITCDSPHPAAFIFRGCAEHNGNGWNPLPKFDAETSMPFANQKTWDERCQADNAKYAPFLCSG